MSTVHTPISSQSSTSTAVDSWSNLIFLVHEPNRHGALVWNVRLVVGDLPPWRFGPFHTENEARKAMDRLIELFEEAVGDIPAELAFFTGCAANQEF